MTPYPTRHWLTALAAASLLASAHAQPQPTNNLNEPISRLLPLQEVDVPPIEDPFCSADLFSESGQRVLSAQENSEVYARFIAVPATDTTAAVPEQVTRVSIMDRRTSGWGGYVLQFWGKPNNEPRWAENTYLLTLKVSGKRPCPGDAGANCYVYQGTLDQTYRFGDKYIPIGATRPLPISTPQQRITLRERCAKDRYTFRGLFEVPGILDFIGGMFLNGR